MHLLQKIIANFNITSELNEFIQVETGHINQSYIVYTKDNTNSYFLQKINHSIFKDVEGLMKNIAAVTQHLANKSKTEKVLALIPTHEGNLFYGNEQDGFWRLYEYIDGSHSYDVVTDASIAFEGGKAFGKFMANLADLEANKLTETIPNFHHLGKRLATFYATLEKNSVHRKDAALDEIKFVEDRSEQMLKITKLIEEGKLPQRITHNDTKVNNVLFNAENKALCVVDLDTVMPGSVLFDFGDAIRTGANTALEDEVNLSKVNINLPIFEAYANGFIQETKGTLTEVELKNLAFSARFMTYIIGLRFLTDFLDGDNYFKTKYPDHNLTRARVQFKLIEEMEKNSIKMETIINNALKNED